jgi:hypothetical protein
MPVFAAAWPRPAFVPSARSRHTRQRRRLRTLADYAQRQAAPSAGGRRAGRDPWASAWKTASVSLDARARPERIRHLVVATGFFSPEEQQIAIELAEERFARARKRLRIHHRGQDASPVGYACCGPMRHEVELRPVLTSCIRSCRAAGWHQLMALAETEIAKAGGTRVYVDTPRKQYAPRDADVHERVGYSKDALLEDYAPGDGKVHVKVLA